MNGLGWMLASLARLRSGEERLAVGYFAHLGRGARLFVVELIYALGGAARRLGFYVPGILIAVSQSHGNGNPRVIALALLVDLAPLGTLARPRPAATCRL